MSLAWIWAGLRALPGRLLGRVLGFGAGGLALLIFWRAGMARLRARVIEDERHEARGRALDTLRRIEDAKRSSSGSGGTWHQRLRRTRPR